MTTRSHRLEIPLAAAPGAAAILGATFFGAAVALNAPLGLALVTAVVYTALAAMNLSWGIALWVPLTFLEGIPALNLGGKAAGLLLLAAWIGALRSGGILSLDVLRRNRRVFELLVLLNVWLTLSLLWATDLDRALEDVWRWWAVSIVFLLIATAVNSASAVRLAAGGYVAGGVLSVVWGIASGELTRETTAAATARLGDAVGDPNFLAAGLVSAIVIAAALLVSVRGPIVRGALVVAIAMMAVGVVSSQSRGGMVAGLAAALAAVVFFRRRRVHAVAVCLLALGAAGFAFATTPGAFERITEFDNGGSGRSDLWTVAWRVFEDNPILGAGINNFGAVSAEYVREPGLLQRVNIVAETPHFVHNVYLQMAAEAGVVGLAILLAFVFGCLAAAFRAGRRFAARGDDALETLSHAVLVAGIGQLAAAMFISSGVDRRVWILFALGPALLGLASRREAGAPPASGEELAARLVPPEPPGHPNGGGNGRARIAQIEDAVRGSGREPERA